MSKRPKQGAGGMGGHGAREQARRPKCTEAGRTKQAAEGSTAACTSAHQGTASGLPGSCPSRSSWPAGRWGRGRPRPAPAPPAPRPSEVKRARIRELAQRSAAQHSTAQHSTAQGARANPRQPFCSPSGSSPLCHGGQPSHPPELRQRLREKRAAQRNTAQHSTARALPRTCIRQRPR